MPELPERLAELFVRDGLVFEAARLPELCLLFTLLPEAFALLPEAFALLPAAPLLRPAA